MSQDDQQPAEAERVRSYEGRPLPRPEEEVVDQGLAFDVVTLLDRRQALRALGAGGVTALGLAACTGRSGSGRAAAPPRSTTSAGSSGPASGGSPTTQIPPETRGPFPGDGSNGPDVLDLSGVVRGDIRSSFPGAGAAAEGVPMRLELVLADLARGGRPLSSAAVYVWHCDREGRYSLYSDGVTDQDYLRGVQVAGADGTVRFTSVFPGCYPGRWPHVHFEVYPDLGNIARARRAVATSQVALPRDACEAVYATTGYQASVGNLARLSLDTDPVFADDGAVRQLATVSGDPTTGCTVSLAVGVDRRTAGAGNG